MGLICTVMYMWRIEWMRGYPLFCISSLFLLENFTSPLVKLTSSSMTRSKAAQDKQQVGRKCTFSKRKEVLLSKFEPCFRESKGRKARSAFYDKLGNWCIAHWGYCKDHSIDLDDEDNNPDEVINIEDSFLPEDNDLTEEEADFRTEYYNTLRTVSRAC